MKKIVGAMFTFLLVGAVASGCSSEGSSSTDLSGRTFVATEVTSEGTTSPTAEGSEIVLTFTPDGISMIAGCNTIFGNASWTNGSITPTAETFGSTMMACSELLMVQDQNLIGFFSQGPSYTLEGSTLTLTTPTATIVMTEQ